MFKISSPFIIASLLLNIIAPYGYANNLFLAPPGNTDLSAPLRAFKRDTKWLLSRYGRKRLCDLTILQASIRIGVTYQHLTKYFAHYPDELSKYGIIKSHNKRLFYNKYIPVLLKRFEKKHIEGLTILQISEFLGIHYRYVTNYFHDYPNDLKKYGIIKKKPLRKNSTSVDLLLKQYGREKLEGLTLKQAAIRINVYQYSLRKYSFLFNDYGIIKNPDRRSQQLHISVLLEMFGKEKLENLNLSETGNILGLSLIVITKYFSNNINELEQYGIVKNRGKIGKLLFEFGKELLNGLSIAKTAQLMGVHYDSLINHFRNSPDDIVKYGVKKYSHIRDNDIQAALVAAGIQHLQGLNILQVSKILSPEIFYGRLTKFFLANSSELTTYGIEKHKGSGIKKDIDGKPTTSSLLKQFGKDQLDGLNISQAARQMSISRARLWDHLERCPNDYINYGIINMKTNLKLNVPTDQSIQINTSL